VSALRRGAAGRPAQVALRRIAPATSLARPCRIRSAWARTHVSASGSPSAKKHQAARHKYSSTCTKSTTTVTRAPRAWASVWMRWRWWVLASSRATAGGRAPGAAVAGVAPGGLVEHRRDDLGGVVGDAGEKPLAACDRPGAARWVLLVGGGQDISWGAGHRGGVVATAALGHPLAVALLPLGQARDELAGSLARRLGRGLPQRL